VRISTGLVLIVLFIVCIPVKRVYADNTMDTDEASVTLAPAVILEKLDVVGATPVSGGGISVDKIPSNLQSFGSEDLDRYQSLNLADFMSRNLGSVTVNNAQGSPFQPDIRYRGFTASPMLGLPQGLSVYVNSVRFNEPFGDTVNWDLIPDGAIEQVVLHPGSNPVYGRNTLGGALVIRTKTGFSAPRHKFRSLYGAWDRHDVELSSGMNDGTFGYFFDLRNFGEKGWRGHSRGKVNQGLGVFSFRQQDLTFDLTLAGNGSDLNGNGSVPIQLLGEDRSAVFTYPDNTRTALFLSSLEGQWTVSDEMELAANAFYRRNRIKTFNGDDSDYEECDANAGFVCEEDETDVQKDVNGNNISTSGTLGATNNITETYQATYGGSLQAIFSHQLFNLENQFVLGGGANRSPISYEADTELGTMNSDRSTSRSGVLLDEARVRLDATVNYWSLFYTDTLSVTDNLSLTASGRYNDTRIVMDDQYRTTLDGLHQYIRFNPAGGFTYKFTADNSLYGRYSESSRAPTPVELSCADPANPCRVPNAFISDPSLEQVVSKTFEGGFRGSLDGVVGEYLDWNAGYYHTRNNNDILFVSAGNQTSRGYFSNVGQTRRHGVEAGATAVFDGLLGGFDQWRISLNYSWIHATFRTPFTVSSPNNPKKDSNNKIHVQAGDKLPGVAEHMVKFSTDIDLWNQFSFGVDMLYNDSQYYRGDEANLNEPVPAYIVFNLRSEIRVTDYLSLFGRVDNLFDNKYETFGTYGQAEEVLGAAYDNKRFRSPASPRTGWVGLKMELM